MLEGINAMQRLNELIEAKHSRVCAQMHVDDENIPKSFKEKFTSETKSDKIVYEYFVDYLQSIAGIVPAVKITFKEGLQRVYWQIAKVAKQLGLFVIGEIKQEDISYIMDNKTKLVIESDILDALIVEIDLYDYDELDNIEKFLKLLKQNAKGTFINIRAHKEEKKKKWWQIIKRRKKDEGIRDMFLTFQKKVAVNCYDKDGKPDYHMIGIGIRQPEDFQIVNTYTFTLFCKYDEEQINDMISVFDGNGLGALVMLNVEETRAETIKKKEVLNNAINEFYGIENF